MKVQNSTQDNLNNSVQNVKNVQNIKVPSFKAGAFDGALNAAGILTQKLQDGGFLASFLVQDGLGMTLPRVWTAFNRDRDITGQYNIQEGFEVLGREGLTGPLMMAMAPVTFLIAAKFGKSTGINSRLIRRYGNSLKEIITSPKFDKALLNNKDKFKELFYKTNIEEILKNTLGKENVSESSVKYIVEQLDHYNNIPKDAKLKGLFGKSKYKKQCISNITEYINDIKYRTSSDLNSLQCVKVGSEKLNNVKEFSTKDAIEAMMKYTDDAIVYNKHLATLDAAASDKLRDESIGKRFIANIATVAATLGMLMVLPKLYARSDVSPGAKTAMQMREIEEKDLLNNDNNGNDQVTFKGKGNSGSWLEKLGKFLTKNVKEKYASELEYNGHNFTSTIMACLSVFGLLPSRMKRAIERAQKDDVTGKKDYSEFYEILIRDLTSSLAVVFAAPMLTRMFISSYEKGSGFVLLQKDGAKTGMKKALDLINPYSSTKVLSNDEIRAIYNNVDTHEKMLNFCKFIDKNDGDLYKILSTSNNTEAVFNENTKKLSDMANMSKKARNAEITKIFEDLGKNKKLGKEKVNKMITELMAGKGKGKFGKVAAFARGLNSVPTVLTTVFITPYLLGIVIPKLTYAHTRKMHRKQEEERKAILNARA